MSSSLAAHVEFLSSLSSALSACDCEEVGFISARFIRDICHEAQLPLSDQLIDGTIMK